MVMPLKLSTPRRRLGVFIRSRGILGPIGTALEAVTNS
jgi:hypothetical protein